MSLFDRVKGWFGGAAGGQDGFVAEGDAARVLDALKTVLDPEVGIDIVSMGLVREIDVDGEGNARVRMTLSTAGCPVGPMIQGQVEEAVRGAGFTPEVAMEFDPPWSPDDMTPEGRARLRAR